MNIYVYELKKPITFEGKKIEKIEMDLESLKFKDMGKAEKIAKDMCGKKERLAIPKEFDSKYTAAIASIASGEKIDMLFELSLVDFTALSTEVSNFLLSGDWDEDFVIAKAEASTSSTKEI